ncbi:MAG TPA: alpha/beta fold hydrolase, partial [Agromyces sp.]
MADYTTISEVSKGLFVFVPGLPSRAPKGRAPWQTLVDRLRADLEPNWRVEVFEHGLTATSRVDLDQVVRGLAAQVRDWTGELSTDVTPPDAIILAGHSFGGILARAAYLQDATAPERTGHPWTDRVKRIVLLGSPNAGYRTDAPGTPLRWRLAYALATPFVDFTFEKVIAGGYWITDLRLRWLEAFRAKDVHRPRVIQVLGTSDYLVTHADVLDQKFMPRAKVYEIPGADHGGLIALDAAKDPRRRYRQLKDAILGRPDETVAQERDPVTAPTVFILHGIRASALGTWVQDLGDAFAKHAPDAAVISPDTGYFSAMEFALPGTRRRKVHEFLRLYGEAYATRDPDRFVFAGHSNGTYMMAQSLDRVPAMRFKRIYLAGTVLPRRYDWQRLFENGQVGHRVDGEWRQGEVRVDRATQDVPVGILCSWLRGLGSDDVGTAGVDGFENITGRAVDQHLVLAGGHGAALQHPPQLRSIADYLARDEADAMSASTTTGDASPRRGWRGRAFSIASRIVGLPLVSWILLGGLGLLALFGLVKLGRAKGTKA